MSDETKLWVRCSPAFKSNVQAFINKLFDCGLRDDTKMSSYVRDAVKEKRDRDRERVDRLMGDDEG